ncbi:MAG TPA: M67 family metallopeptidase [Actinomycetota bacterium]
MLEIDRGFFDEMVEHGLAGFPYEACGLLAGKEGRPIKFFRMRNVDASPVTYRLDPREHLAVSNEMDDEGWDLLGIFHTHTHTEAYPSPTDVERALWPGGTQVAFPSSWYLIMSLADRSAPVLRAFRIVDGGEVTEEELVVS